MTADPALYDGHAYRCRRAITGEVGIRLPPFIDHHVHLHLIDGRMLPARGVAGVVDLGGDPATLARRPAGGLPRVAYAGAFLTAPGGYPVGRAWAPAAVVREVRSASAHPGAPGGAETVVDEQAAFGARLVKVALSSEDGPVLGDEILAAIVGRAHALGLPVVAHVQGSGMTRRALDAGVDALAHTPFTEGLDAATIARAAASQTWISTLAIHDGPALALATANLAAFHAAGGRVVYGTDLGNGDLPVGVNELELERLAAAGIDAPALIRALVDPWPFDDRDDGVGSFVAGDMPADAEVPAWLARAVVVPVEELVADER